jgi:uroporphyrin-III C-methyltransferase/precorrin-2 dehydrogenase/sirohydrochlorin ferrochelatase
MLMPATLAAWGARARAIRGEVSARLKPGAERRAFWEQFAERAFGAAPPDGADADASISMVLAEQRPAGRVTLVGAGPGDPELLTIKAVRALQSADVILYDDLVSDEVLELARREAKRMMVGKRGRRESCAQDDINALMLKLAGQGKHVVRLKSGDPMIFGRAGEEIAELESAGIPVTVVAGITAGVALAAELGMSLTHRDHAQSVRFVTGHSRRGDLPDLDWLGLSDPATTLVFYMAGHTAGAIASKLIANGLPETTAVVARSGIGRADGQKWTGTLASLRTWQPFDDGHPTLIAIGRALARAKAGQTNDSLLPTYSPPAERARLQGGKGHYRAPPRRHSRQDHRPQTP